MAGRSFAGYLSMALLAGTLAACADSIPRQALQLSPESLQQLQLQSRYFETGEEAFILSAAAAVLQDLGFNLDESETDLGVLVASKQRDATQVGQIAGSIVVAIFTGEFIPVDDHQTIRASLVTKPSAEGEKRVTVRIIFQRIIWNTDGYVSRYELIDEPEIYQEFFSKLSNSVFLEARTVWRDPK